MGWRWWVCWLFCCLKLAYFLVGVSCWLLLVVGCRMLDLVFVRWLFVVGCCLLGLLLWIDAVAFVVVVAALVCGIFDVGWCLLWVCVCCWLVLWLFVCGRRFFVVRGGWLSIVGF